MVVHYPSEITEPFLEKLQLLYQNMDDAYLSASAYYGFECTGCEKNCCYTHFYHHTHIEHAYLLLGFSSLSEDIKKNIRKNAVDSINNAEEHILNGHAVHVLCPLNHNQKCIIYPYRPMICRLHGIQHELKISGKGTHYGPGCELFMNIAHAKPYYPFDRTPFYMQLAQLEDSFKKTLAIQHKFKMTISQMLYISSQL
ncbi:MAG: hypothetical protein HQK77_01455 [Desulfobacterales bacterium]|nr:hypothetical protein [Desulfobacterales bacterium]